MEYFRRKIVMEVKEIFSDKCNRTDEQHDSLVRTLEAFDLESTDFIDILKKCVEMKVKKINDRPLFVKVIVFCLRILTEAKNVSLQADTISKLGTLLTQIEPSEIVLEALCDYLNESPYNIKNFEVDFMSELIKNEALTVSNALTRVLTLVLERDTRHHANFTKFLAQSIQRRN